MSLALLVGVSGSVFAQKKGLIISFMVRYVQICSITPGLIRKL